MSEEVLLSKQFLDDEITLRKQGDLRISIFTGQPTDTSQEPLNTSPEYTSLIDLVASETLELAIGRLDRVKNSLQTVTLLDGSTVTNPKSVRLVTNLGQFGLYSDGAGYRINVNTTSSVPFVKTVYATYGYIRAIGSAARVIKGITTYSEKVNLST
jgi:hypothetical protein